MYFPQVQVTGDIANAVWRIAEGVGTRSHWDFTPFERSRAGLDAQFVSGAADDRFPIYPARLVAEVRRAMPEDGPSSRRRRFWSCRSCPADSRVRATLRAGQQQTR